MSSRQVKAKIGIYNLHMQTRGGGEKLTLALAEHLSSKHDVRLFHDRQLDIRSLEHVFAVDLSRVKFIRLKGLELPLRAVARLRGDRLPAFSLHHYLELRRLNLDLFINASYASSVRCPATKGVFLCMFPRDPGSQNNGAGDVPKRAAYNR